MRPYPRSGKLNRRKNVFNYRLSRARRIVENVFGILCARMRIFRKPTIASISTATRIIKATTCLHNFIISEELEQPHAERRYMTLNALACHRYGRRRNVWQKQTNKKYFSNKRWFCNIFWNHRCDSMAVGESSTK